MSRVLPAVLLCFACATSRSATEEDDRLSAQEHSLPSSRDGEAQPAPAPATTTAQTGKLTPEQLRDLSAQAEESARKVKEAKDKSDAQCRALEGRPVPQAEEDAMGLELALGEVAGKGLYADGVAREPAALKPLLQARLASLPAGDKSAVSAYVQKLAASLGGPKLRVTVAVIDDPSPRLRSEMGGWLLLSSGLLARLSDESELAAALGHELAHVAAKDPAAAYAKARFNACTISTTGANLVIAGAGNMPGGSEAVKGSQFSSTAQVFAADDIVAELAKPGVDASYVRWMLGRTLDNQRMLAPLELEQAADAAAVKLLTAAGYDTKGLAKVIPLITTFSVSERTAAVEKLQKKGKAPPFPAQLKWPKP